MGKGGRRSYGRWLKYLAEPYYNIAEGKFVETFKSDKELQQYIVDNVDELKNIITRHHRTATWKMKWVLMIIGRSLSGIGIC